MAQKNRSIKLLIIAALILTGMTVLSFATNNSRIKTVDVVIDGERTTIKTSKNTVSQLLEAKRISLGNSDYINISTTSPLHDGMKVEIKRAVPVTINYGGNILDIKTSKNTVKEVLDSLKISYNPDKISPSKYYKIKPGLEIDIVKIDEKVETISKVIPYKTITKDNDTIDKGKFIVKQEGKEGKKEITVKETYENGQLVATEIVEEKILSEPTNELIEKGTKGIEFTVASRGSFAGKKEAIMIATAYDLTYESTGKKPGDKWYGITASGTKARPGVVAVDPKVIPLGTKLYIESLDGTKDYGYAIAEDTGGAIKGNKIDLFMEDPKDVKAFGRRKVKVYILGK